MKEKVLITGGSGFLGSYILEAFQAANFATFTLGRSPVASSTQHITHNLSDQAFTLPDEHFQKVVHVAGKAHSFPKTEEEAKVFYQVNLAGTEQLLKALDGLSQKPRIFVFISTVAVYGVYAGEQISESAPLQANTPYGISKLKAEKVVTDWCQKRQINYLILRLPLIAGANPPGNLGDMKKAIDKGYYVKIGNNTARKSVVAAGDIAQLIVRANEVQGIYNLTDGYHPSFSEIEEAISERVKRKISIRIPEFPIKIAAWVGDALSAISKKEMPISSLRLQKITSTLTFDDSKAQRELQWRPQKVLEYIKKHL